MILGILAILTVPTAASARPAATGSASGTGLLVTVAARECPTYQDIRANLARNNIQESLQDLGEDTLYSNGEPINPKLELEGQPKCKPITGWQFTLGSGIKEKASTGPWGALSIVTGAESPTVTTEASTPLLGWNGETIPGVSIKGATTFELNQAQAERSAGHYLWIQGGTTSDPVLYTSGKFAGKYGFGALRCSIDNLNGDNVETIDYPVGITHAFCYAYYVTPPPASGTIVIRKEVKGSGSDGADFSFGGNVSYNQGGTFDLSASPGSPGEQTFFRAETRPGDESWKVNEEVPDGWTLSELRCEHGASQVTTDRSTAGVSIDLAAGDTVTCTYVDQLRPPAGALLLGKVTENGVGTFRFRVRDSSGDVVRRTSITTEEEGEPEYAKPMILAPGDYEVEESSPHTDRGDWKLVDVNCNGDHHRGSPTKVTVADKEGEVCTFTNRLNFHARLSIIKEAIGNVGTAAFQITTPSDPELQLHQAAVVKEEKTTVLAAGDSTHGLPYGTYVIQEYAGKGTDPTDWSLIEVVCDGKAIPFGQGRAVVRLSRSDPSKHCRFVDLFSKEPTPPAPGPGPEPNPGPGPQPGEDAETSVSKTLVDPGTGPTPTETYQISVKNDSGVTASHVVVTDQPGPGLAVTSAEPSAGGSCLKADQYICTFDSIPAHGEATVIVKAKNYGGGTYNRAVVGSASPDGDPANNVDAARAESPKRHFKACGSSLSIAFRC
ncbi:MAG: hypothetical protein BGO11_16470 [Solirubrobacterales bacterium 70-9]|nr:MAG: hypothetical protein BGO11_16470 [Solirubrobacterales bacterium 70-9]